MGYDYVDEVANENIPLDSLGPLNIYADPLLNFENGFPILSENSPCIDAGDPNAPLDPDGSRTDIGVYYFPQANIAVEPRLIRFENRLVGEGIRDSALVMIRNTGFDTLRVFLDEQSISLPFSVIDWNQDTLLMPPLSATVCHVVINSRLDDVFDDTLDIYSSDRDEPIITVCLTNQELYIRPDFPISPVMVSPPTPNPSNSSFSVQFTLP
jgi:hypothetical protein